MRPPRRRGAGKDAWAFEGSYRLLSYGFRVRATSASAGAILDRIFGAARWEAPPDAPAYALVQASPRARRPFAVSVDGRPILRTASPCAAFRALVRQVVWETVRATDDLALFRSGAASCDGTAVLLPAAPRAGKTTLVAALVRRGFSFGSDDVAAVDPSSGRLVPFPLPLSLKRASFRLLPDLDPQLPEALARFVEGEWPVRPDDVRPGATGDGAAVAHVVFPRWEEGGQTSLVSVDRGRGFAELVQQGLNLPALGAEGVDRLRDGLAGVRYHRLGVGSLERAVRQVRLLMAGRLDGRPSALVPANASLGEFVSLPERLVVAPTGGRLRRRAEEGQGVTEGQVIGSVVEGERGVVLVAPAAGVLLGWMAGDGERVAPGRPVARLGDGRT